MGTSSMIAYINKDEKTHVVLFERILCELLKPEHHTMASQLVESAVNQEIRWSQTLLGDKVLGISKTSIEQYTKYLANNLLKRIGEKHPSLISVASEGDRKGEGEKKGKSQVDSAMVAQL